MNMFVSDQTCAVRDCSEDQFVPLTYRILFVNAVNIPWNTYLSLQASNATPGTEKAKVSEKSFGE